MAASHNSYESTDGGNTYNYFDSVTSTNPGTAAPATTYTATGLTAGSTPAFYVTAENASGESLDQSNTASLANPIPIGVASVTATPSADGSSATVTWITDTSALGYAIFRTPDDGSTGPVLMDTITDSSTASYTDDTVTDTDSYTYEVDPYYTNPPPTAPGSNGTGPNGSASSYTGNVGSFNAKVDGGSANLTWSFQGNANFEIEEKDPSASGTNYILINDPTKTTGRAYPVSGLKAGYTYSFRIRADRSDGTVSDYVTTSADIPATPTPPPTTAPTSTIQQPTLTGPEYSDAPAGEWGGPLSITPYSNSADPGTDYWLDLYQTASRDGDKLNIENDGQADPGGVSGTTGATYYLEASYYDYTSGASSPLSSPLKVTTSGTLPPQLSLQPDGTDSSGNPVVKWDMPSGVTAGTVSFYYMGRKNGQAAAVYACSDSDMTNAKNGWSLTGLPAGTSSVFAIYDATGCTQTDAYGYPMISGLSPYSNDVTVNATGGIPAAPQSVSGTYITGTGGAPGYVQLHWTNSSNNETSFEIWRSSNGAAGPWTKLGSVPADPTMSFTDKTMTGLGPWTYEVRARNNAGKSAWTLSAAIAPIGGPDITVHLLAIRRALFVFGNANPANAAQLTNLLNNATLSEQDTNWDIYALSGHNPYVSTPTNDGLLPDGSPTCTVQGKVYYDYEVNYWLYGSWLSFVGDSQELGRDLVVIRRNIKNLKYGLRNDAPGKAAWFDAGYDGDLAVAAGAMLAHGSVAIPGVSPGTGDPGPLDWHVGVQGTPTDHFGSN
jgi:hypothetical protein